MEVSVGVSETAPAKRLPVGKRSPVHEVALALDHVKLMLPPSGMDGRSEASVAVTGAPSVTVTLSVTMTPPGPKQVAV